MLVTNPYRTVNRSETRFQRPARGAARRGRSSRTAAEHTLLRLITSLGVLLVVTLALCFGNPQIADACLTGGGVGLPSSPAWTGSGETGARLVE